MTRKKVILYFWIGIPIIAFAIALLIFAYLGTFSRYQADDYCIAANVRLMGFWKTQTYMYTNWANSFSTNFLLSTIVFIGPRILPALPALVLLFWVFAIYWFISNALPSLVHGIAILLAEMLVFFVIFEAPERYQTLYWLSGMIPYLLSLVLLTFLGHITLVMAKRIIIKPNLMVYVGMGLASFLIGGFSETTVALQIGVFALALIGVWFAHKKGTPRRGFILLGIGFVSALLSMLVLIIAPGNIVRQALLPPPPNLIKLVTLSLRFALDFSRDSLKSLPLPTALSLTLPMLLAYVGTTRQEYFKVLKVDSVRLILFLLIAPIIGYLLIVCICAPSVYGESAYPEQRVLIAARYVMVTVTMFEGILFGILIGNFSSNWNIKFPQRSIKILAACFLILASFYPLRAALLTSVQIPEYRSRAMLLDARDSKIRIAVEQGITNIVVQAIDSTHLLMELGPNVDLWVNRCAASYYGAKSIQASIP
jgi:hypothetical protein